MNKKEQELIRKITSKANAHHATTLQSFFKTKKGEYGYEDIFLGVKVPLLRKISKNYEELSFVQIRKLLESPIHEIRFCGLIILIKKYERAIKNNDVLKQKEIFTFYIQEIKNINSWDLVDVSAAKIIGHFVYYNKAFQKELIKLSLSKNMWEQRIAIVATHYFIKRQNFTLTLRFAKQNIIHEHDLMHKATGWMLREVGKQNKEILNIFLKKHAQHMPRVMLRYAIEKHSEDEQKKYLAIKYKQKINKK
ncbi:MAG: DNA alkylation repair protein [Candidatus Woesearchaeota archaeon]